MYFTDNLLKSFWQRVDSSKLVNADVVVSERRTTVRRKNK